MLFQLAGFITMSRLMKYQHFFQVECHPYLSQDRLTQFCADRNVTLICFGVLGSKGTPADYKESNVSVIEDSLIKVMSAGLGISPAQLLVR